jgi:5'(3')-deoxyribonucleotidase
MPTSTATRKTIAIDMDEVIADALSEHLLRYNREFAHDKAEHLTPAHLHGRWIWDAVPARRVAALERYMLSDDFFAVLDVMPESQRVLERLQSRYNVFIATAAMEVPTSFTAKFEWLARHFPFSPASHVVFCGDKGILRADYLIDDNPRQLQRFEAKSPANPKPLCEGILYTSPTNINVKGYRRVHDWFDVEKLFLP